MATVGGADGYESGAAVRRDCCHTSQMRCTTVTLVSTARIHSAHTSSGATMSPITVMTTRSGRASYPPLTLKPSDWARARTYETSSDPVRATITSMGSRVA